MKENNKEPIRIRRKRLANGNVSLYLDLYSKGRRKYEFLRLYLIPERSREDKEKNRATMQLANAIKSKRIVEMQNKRYGFECTDKGKVLFFDYCKRIKELIDEKYSESTRLHWKVAIDVLNEYERDKSITIDEIDKEWVEGFLEYMRTRDASKSRARKMLKANTQELYYRKFKAIMGFAERDGLIRENPIRLVHTVKAEDAERMYLTMDEIRAVARSSCRYEEVKKAFLFSCLTGMRRGDIIALRWGEVHDENGMARIIFRQGKTKGQEYLDINQQAQELMGERGADDERVFRLPSLDSLRRSVAELMRNAGIRKKITFHCARHTFATMMLDIGTDIYTVSKLLGHRDIDSTQIYARILDKNKRKAVESIPDIL